jgi:Pyruvate/2-oxoacid:ferredoxin oxidoreductase delta subunit
MNHGKPLWQKDIKCYYCYACFNFCPEQAILVKNYTYKDGRYYHPNVTAKDIAEQKGL